MHLFKLITLMLAITALTLGCVEDAGNAEKYAKPTVNAGSDQVKTLPINSFTLRGSAKTYPKHLYRIKTTLWRQISGPQKLSILNADELTATILNPTTAGTYEFELYAKDSLGRTNTDRIKIILNAAQSLKHAQTTPSYTDDYDALWHYVVNEYAGYSEIEDQWQQFYQRYWIKASEVNSEQKWQQLLAEIENKLGSVDLLFTQTQQESPQQLSVHWSENNGIATITLDNINVRHWDKLNQQVSTHIMNSPSVHRLEIKLLNQHKLDRQTQLMLMQAFSAQKAKICLRDKTKHKECVQINAVPYLKGLEIDLLDARTDPDKVAIKHYFNSWSSSAETVLRQRLRLEN